MTKIEEMKKQMESKFEYQLDYITYSNRSKIDSDGNWPELSNDELTELCCLYCLEDINNKEDTKEEILGLNYNDDAIEFVELITKMILSFTKDRFADNWLKARQIAEKSMVKFYEDIVTKIYENKMQEIINRNDDNEDY